MALKVAEVLIKWRSSGADQVAADNKKLGDSLTSIGEKAKTAGAVLSAGLTAPLVLIGKSAVDAASDLNESMSAVNTVFGDTSKQVMDFSRTAASQLGQSRQAALSAAAGMGALFKGVGLNETQMADFSTSLLKASADLGSFYNVDPGQALDKLRSGLVGEAEGLRSFGILLNEAAVEAKGLEMGLGDANDELSEGAKVQARYALIMEQLGSAQGDFARTSDGLANSQRVLAARMQDIRAEIGTYLLPYALKAADAFSGLLDRFMSMSEQSKGLAVAIGAVAAAAGPVLVIVGQLVSTAGTLAPLLGALTGPLGLVALAVVGLGVAFKENWFGIRDLVTQVTDRVGESIGRVIQFFSHAKERGLDPFRLAFRTLIVTLGEGIGKDHPFVQFLQQVLRFGERLKTAFDANGFSGAIDEMIRTVGKIDGDAIKATLANTGGQIMTGLLHGLQDFWNNQIAPWLHGVIDGLPHLFDNAGAWLDSSGLKIVQGLLHGMQAFWNNTLSQWLHGVITGLPELFRTAYDWLKEPGAQLIDGFRHGAQDLFNNNLQPWLQSLSNTIQGLFQTAGDWLAANGASLISGLYNGATSYWETTLSPWLSSLMGSIQGLFTEAGTWLTTQGNAVMQGLLDGVTEKFLAVATFFQNLGASIVGALPKDWGSLLYNTGASIIQGLWDGMVAKWDEANAWLSNLVPNVPSVGGGAPSDKPDKGGGGGGGGDFRAFGGPLGNRLTMVGEFGPELLINKSLVMPHGASMSRIQAMGGMAYGGTGNWSEWLAQQDSATRASVRRARNGGLLNADMRQQFMAGMGYNGVKAYHHGAMKPGDPDHRTSSTIRRSDSAANWGHTSPSTNMARQSDALNRASAYGDRTGDYSRRERVLAREARNGTLQQGGLSTGEKQYLITNYGTIHVQAKDSNVARAIGDQLSSRDR